MDLSSILSVAVSTVGVFENVVKIDKKKVACERGTTASYHAKSIKKDITDVRFDSLIVFCMWDFNTKRLFYQQQIYI